MIAYICRNYCSPDVSHLLGSRGGRRPALLPFIGGILSNSEPQLKFNHDRLDLSDDDFQYSATYPEEIVSMRISYKLVCILN